MLKDVLDFVGNNFFYILMFGLFFGSGIYNFLRRILERRHEFKLQQLRQAHEIKLLQEQRLDAEVANDGIRLLIADEALGKNFHQQLADALQRGEQDRRLRVAKLEKQGAAEDAELEATLEAQIAADAAAKKQLKALTPVVHTHQQLQLVGILL